MSLPCCPVSVLRGHIPSHLHPTCTLPRHLNPFHPHHPSLGSLLFYARALDLSVLTAVCQLSSHQSNPTQHDLSAAHRLLNYVSSHSNPQKTIHRSSMALWACTDASFLSRPKSGSVAGCSVGLGDPAPYLLNPPPRKPQTEHQDQTDPCPCFPPSSIQPLFYPTHLCHP